MSSAMFAFWAYRPTVGATWLLVSLYWAFDPQNPDHSHKLIITQDKLQLATSGLYFLESWNQRAFNTHQYDIHLRRMPLAVKRLRKIPPQVPLSGLQPLEFRPLHNPPPRILIHFPYIVDRPPEAPFAPWRALPVSNTGPYFA